MKKLIIIIIFLQIVILNFINIKKINDYYISKNIYNDSTRISLFSDTHSDLEYIKESVIKISRKYNIDIFKVQEYPYNNEYIISKKHSILLNENGKNITINKGEYYTTNKEDENTINYLNSINNKYFVETHSLYDYEFNYFESLWVRSTNNSDINKIIEEMKNINGIKTVEIGQSYFFKNIYVSILLNINFIVTFLIFIFMIFLITSFYILNDRKKLTIINYHGFNKVLVLKMFFISFIKMFLISLLISLPIIIIFNATFIHLKLFVLIKIFLIFIFLIFIIYILYSTIFIFITYKFLLNISYIKNHKSNRTILYITLFSKIAITVILLLNINFIIEEQKELKNYIKSEETWNQYSEFAKTSFYGITKENEKQEDYHIEYHYQFKNSLYDLNKKNAFIANFDNYAFLSYRNEFLYETNTKNENPLIDPSGKNIIVSENYFKYNKIQLIDHFNIIYEKDVVNLIVPISLKKYEEEIIKNYKEDLYNWIKFENKHYGKNSDLTIDKIDDIKVNIMYAENEQEYFTLNPNIDNKNAFKVIDPIVIIANPENIILGNMTSIVDDIYIPIDLENEQEELKEIEQIFKDNGVINFAGIDYPSIEVLKRIKFYRTELIYLDILFLSVLIVLYFLSYKLILIYIETNKYKIYVKNIFGYNFFKINKNIFIIILISNLPTFYYITKYPYIVITILIFEILLTEYSVRKILKKSFNEIIKGGK